MKIEQNFAKQNGQFNFLSLLEAKRDGRTLCADEIRWIINSYTAGAIPDYQMSAFLMAVYFRGLSPSETGDLTIAMLESGKKLQFPADPRPLVDKHSTGGVGDKVSLPLVPLLVSLGFRVPMISGRGLGITGGTLDKLESIPGLTTSLSLEQIINNVQSTGCVICGQTDDIVPADRALYSLRDVTGTVPSIPLIVASILSKKLAESIQALILDVKYGSGTFMQDVDSALILARSMVEIGNECGVKTRAIISNMDVAIGRSAGNWLEIKETVDFLKGNRPEDLEELVVECAVQLLVLSGKTEQREIAIEKVFNALNSDKPLKIWEAMLRAQGADLEAYYSKLTQDHTAPVVLEFKAERPGYISRCDARGLGELIRELGGGRKIKGAPINYDVGIDKLAKPGDYVEKGDIIARVHLPDDSCVPLARHKLCSAIEISDAPPDKAPRIWKVI